MKRFAHSWAFAGLALGIFFAAMAPRAAAQDGGIAGQILDVAAKPWADIPVQIVSDQGVKSDTKTDKNGKYSFNNLRSGDYTISLNLPGQKEPYTAGKVKVGAGQTVPVDLNFKDIVGKQSKEFEAAKQKQEEEKQKFQGMKQHFEADCWSVRPQQRRHDESADRPTRRTKTNVTSLNEKPNYELKRQLAPKKILTQLIMARLATPKRRRTYGRARSGL